MLLDFNLIPQIVKVISLLLVVIHNLNDLIKLVDEHILAHLFVRVILLLNEFIEDRDATGPVVAEEEIRDVAKLNRVLL